MKSGYGSAGIARKTESTKNSLLTLALAIVLLCASVTSIHFAASELDHDCTGSDCPVCMVIMNAEASMQSAAEGIKPCKKTVSSIEFTVLNFAASKIKLEVKTSVSKKIKLSN
ncbi:MAG: hypothetical protein J5817_05175 [Treponema sp.]|nr:hypothetical protein [Treponema sp.]